VGFPCDRIDIGITLMKEEKVNNYVEMV